MNNFRCYIPTTVFLGKGEVEKLSAMAESGKRVLMVYGGGSIKANHIYDEVIGVLETAGLKVFELSGVKHNPRIETVRKGIEICRRENVDMVLGVGGGSVIDTSKVIAAGAVYAGDPWDLVLDSQKILSALPIYVVSTISATGSEMSPWAVISDWNKKEKHSTGGDSLWPRMSILDPEYTYSVPTKFAAAGIADISSHILENYFTNVSGGVAQENLCEALLKTVVECGETAVKKPDDYDAKANLMWCSCLAMNGLLEYGAETPWGVHGMEHELSAYYDIIHGEGLAILTTVWMRYAIEKDTSKVLKFARYGRNVWHVEGSNDYVVAQAAIAKTEWFYFDVLKLPRNLRAVGVVDDHFFHDMAINCSSRFKTAFLALSVDEIEELYRRAL